MNLLEPVLAHLAEHPRAGARPQVGALTIERRHGGPPDYTQAGAFLVGDAPGHLAVSVELLKGFADGIATFTDGTLTLHLDSGDLAYRPLYADDTWRTVVFERCKPAAQANAPGEA